MGSCSQNPCIVSRVAVFAKKSTREDQLASSNFFSVGISSTLITDVMNNGEEIKEQKFSFTPNLSCNTEVDKHQGGGFLWIS